MSRELKYWLRVAPSHRSVSNSGISPGQADEIPAMITLIQGGVRRKPSDYLTHADAVSSENSLYNNALMFMARMIVTR